MVWRLLYSWQGPINSVLNMLGGDRTHFLADNATIIPALAIVAVWASGNIIVIKIAGLGNVPRVYQEAAEIDGANAWQRFWRITIPCMTPIIFYNLLMSLITNFQIVIPALALTHGGPNNASMFISYLMYHFAFRSYQIGYASAIAFVFFIIIAIFTGILFLTSRNWIFYEGDDR
jgi:multiple sugar transport system permease protein